MWGDIITEVVDRALAARTYFSAAVGPPHSPRGFPIPPHELTAKGLMFVHLYGTYEYAVREAVRASLHELKTRPMPLSALRLDLLSLALDGNLQSCLECSPKRLWKTRAELFRRVVSTDHFDTPDTLFPHDGSHYRVEQLRTIWELFGVTAGVVPDGRLHPLIGELVEHRNAIAHGRRTAEEVGGGYSVADVYNKIDGTRDICLHVLTTLQSHCSNPANCLR